MRYKIMVVIMACAVCLALTVDRAAARMADDRLQTQSSEATQNPALCLAAHWPAKLLLSVTNMGVFANGFYPGAEVDCFTGQPIPAGGAEYPAGSGKKYVFAGALWVGAVVGGDTLVSTGADGWAGIQEMFPDEAPFGNMIKRSNLDPGSPEYDGAVSNLDYIAVYTDTFVNLPAPDPEDGGRPHHPLNVEVTQKSYSWGYPYADDFIIFEFEIRNIGMDRLDDAYIGIYVDADVCANCSASGFSDDVAGFVDSAVYQAGGSCEYTSDMAMAWIADNDGELQASFPSDRVPDVTATSLLRAPLDTPLVSFNWWVSNGNPDLDFGPRMRGTPEDPYRDFGSGGTGTPTGDANKYYVMSHSEIDYNQVFTGIIGSSNPVWMEPPAFAADLADGFDTRYLMSFGPFDIEPGQTLPLAVAHVAGQGFHTVPDNLGNLPADPGAYMANLNFQGLHNNARWADWVYDNPGVDTDSDGYRGEFVVCGLDTLYVKGDGIPDRRAASAPPPPALWLDDPFDPSTIPVLDYLRFNGTYSETTRDVFSGEIDFEGYHVYMQGPDGRPVVRIASWDREDFYKWVWNPLPGMWEPDRTFRPYSLQDLRCAYGDLPNPCQDESFDPNSYTQIHPFRVGDSLMYFEPVLLNANEYPAETMIRKAYPDQPYPSTLNPAQADPSELTADGLFKYFEYEMDLPQLIPGEQYCFSVTAYDYGSIISGVPPLESDRTANEKCKQAGEPLLQLVQWRREDGGNDHWYGAYAMAYPWEEALRTAPTLSVDSMPGYLATVQSSAENQFILDSVLSRVDQPAAVDQYWLGGMYVDTEWVWIDREPFAYANWAAGEPDNLPHQSALAVYGTDNDDSLGVVPGTWSSEFPRDIGPSSLHWSVVEFGTDSAGPIVIPTSEWINVYCLEPMLNDRLLRTGDVITAYDPDGVLCGMDTVVVGEGFGFMPVYRDDPYSIQDEGAEPGDLISFRINGLTVNSVPLVAWTENGAGFEVCEFTSCLKLHLDEGWNLISWNRLYEATIEEFVSLLTPCGRPEVILGFDQGAQTYDPDLPQYSTLHRVDYRHGYWVNLPESCTVEICGDLITVFEFIFVHPGWNLVSYWPERPLPIDSALGTIQDVLQVALGYDQGGSVYVSGDTLHNTLTELRPGLGYWLRAGGAGGLVYPGWLQPPTGAVADYPAGSLGKSGRVVPSRTWMSIFGSGITLDGQPLKNGALIEVISDAGLVCGRGKYTDGLLSFTPVYGRDDMSERTASYPKDGDKLTVMVDGRPVYPGLVMETDGSRVRLGVLSSDPGGLPVDFALAQNYPNPFNPSTEISFSLPRASHVTLNVFNITGRRVATLVDRRLEAGDHAVTWDGTDESGARVATGVYLYRIEAAEFTSSRKMLLVK